MEIERHEGDAVVWLVVNEWDLESDDEGTATEADAGVISGQRFGFSPEDILVLLGKAPEDERGLTPASYVGGYERALQSLLEGDDVEDLQEQMMGSVSDETGWCILSCVVEAS